MFKRKKAAALSCGLVAAMLLNLAPVSADPSIDAQADIGLIKGTSLSLTPNSVVRIEKGSTKYEYHVKSSSENYSLQMGNGTYKISVYEHVKDNKYQNVAEQQVELSLADDKVVYLNSVQMLNFNDNMKAIEKAKELTSGLSSDKEKFNAIHKYIYQNVTYDLKKAEEVVAGKHKNYVPNIEEINKLKKGICFDYSSLMGSMLRAVGIPAKLVMGYTDYIAEYHAWNEVYVGGKWITVDATSDAAYYKADKAVTAEKKSSQFKKSKQY